MTPRFHPLRIADVRLLGHLAAAAAFVLMLGDGRGILTAPILILALAWMTNLYNFMDGSDGLAGGIVGERASGVQRLCAQVGGLHCTEQPVQRRLDLLLLLAAERGVSLILVGNPIRLDGEEGRRSEWARAFSRKLAARTGREVG